MKKVLWIGAHVMSEIDYYCVEPNRYDEGIFIEAMPSVFPYLQANLNRANKKYGTKFQAINALITNEDYQFYRFNLFNNKGEQCSGSSSIYQENKSVWHFQGVEKRGTVELQSIKFQTLVETKNLNLEGFTDLVIDVQGAELQVLKSMGRYLDRFNNMKIEASTKQFYSGSVLFNKLNDFITNAGFKLISKEVSEHGDVVYTRIKPSITTTYPVDPPMKKVKNRVTVNSNGYLDTFDVQVYLKSPGLLYIEVIRTDLNQAWNQNLICTLYGIDGIHQTLEIGSSTTNKKTVVHSTNMNLIL